MEIIYKNFIIKKGYQEWLICDNKGKFILMCRTKKEAIRKIDNEEV